MDVSMLSGLECPQPSKQNENETNTHKTNKHKAHKYQTTTN